MKVKLNQILKIAGGVGDIFTGGQASNILDVVMKSANNSKDPGNVEALKALAEMNEAQNQAIVALHNEIQKLKKHLKVS